MATWCVQYCQHVAMPMDTKPSGEGLNNQTIQQKTKQYNAYTAKEQDIKQRENGREACR